MGDLTANLIHGVDIYKKGSKDQRPVRIFPVTNGDGAVRVKKKNYSAGEGAGDAGGLVSLPRPINMETRRFSLKKEYGKDWKHNHRIRQKIIRVNKILIKEYILIINFFF